MSIAPRTRYTVQVFLPSKVRTMATCHCTCQKTGTPYLHPATTSPFGQLNGFLICSTCQRYLCFLRQTPVVASTHTFQPRRWGPSTMSSFFPFQHPFLSTLMIKGRHFPHLILPVSLCRPVPHLASHVSALSVRSSQRKLLRSSSSPSFISVHEDAHWPSEGLRCRHTLPFESHVPLLINIASPLPPKGSRQRPYGKPSVSAES